MSDSDFLSDVATEVVGQLVGKLLNQEEGAYDIGAVIVNNSDAVLENDVPIKLHHGQSRKPQAYSLPPHDGDDTTESWKKSITEVFWTSIGAACSEGIIVYTAENNAVRIAIYLKHGKNVECGIAIWEPGKKVNDEDYDEKIKPHSDGSSLIHTIQKGRPQTIYCKNNESGSTSTFKVNGYFVTIVASKVSEVVINRG